MPAEKKPLEIVLVSPRGFCAGVERAIATVEEALRIYGAPVYVRHQIVHNAHVVEALARLGAVFVTDLSSVPKGAPVVFSAHGVARSVPEDAKRLGLHAIDATCPLVAKVHFEARSLARQGCHILLIGHAGHPEVIGTLGQVARDSITLIETIEDARSFTPPYGKPLAVVTQTTLSMLDTADILDCLCTRFPTLHQPKKADICYATANRQRAVMDIAANCDAFFVLGDSCSSNSRRLVEVAKKAGCSQALLLLDQSSIDWNLLGKSRRLGLTAGASAPEKLVRAVLDCISKKYRVKLLHYTATDENVHFKLPPLPALERE